MVRRTGSWPYLGTALLVFLLAFVCLRQRSSFLAIEAQLDTARAVAATAAIALPDALALRDLVGAEVPDARWRAAATEFAALLPSRGRGLAAVTVAGSGARVQAALAAAGGDAERAWAAFRIEAEAVPGLRFLAMSERFARRLHQDGRDD